MQKLTVSPTSSRSSPTPSNRFSRPTTVANATLDIQEDLRKRRVTPTEKFRNDYIKCSYVVDKFELTFHLDAAVTVVESKLVLRRQPDAVEKFLRLDGENLELHVLKVNGRDLDYTREFTFGTDEDPDCIIINAEALPDDTSTFTVETTIKNWPSKNTELTGLYESRGILTTQCEAEGFRRITYAIDRPDSMAKFLVTLIADKELYPVLLSNGNRTEYVENYEEVCDFLVQEKKGPWHKATFDDPFNKGCHLFALVAGKLDFIKEAYKTGEGNNVDVFVWSEPKHSMKLHWAMECVLRAMKWDEEKFGRYYDLNIFNIVAIEDFNMGAMENKSLNIFNSNSLLASKETSTDDDFTRVLGVVGHEYFHNWTGNRVSVRDWFQVTLKEGLTKYREKEFVMDSTSAAVKRIEDVIFIRGNQFPEDAGPMVHQIRPESFMVMDNFYTTTVYHKGSEVVGLFSTILGKNGFRKGMDRYFELNDGKTVTCDDFIYAMGSANDKELNQMTNWYSQKGTPVVRVDECVWNETKQEFRLTLSQILPGYATNKDCPPKPYYIPVKVGLIGRNSKRDVISERVLHLVQMNQTFVFENIKEDVVISILRNFSAPVKVDNPNMTDEDLAFLMAYDSDPVNRWDAGERLMKKQVYGHIAKRISSTGEKVVSEDLMKAPSKIDTLLVDAFKAILSEAGSTQDRHFLSHCLTPPLTSSIIDGVEGPADPSLVRDVQDSIRAFMCNSLKDELEGEYAKVQAEIQSFEKYEFIPHQVGCRRFRGSCLKYLSADATNIPGFGERLLSLYKDAQCMSDKETAFAIACGIRDELPDVCEKIISDFLQDAIDEPFVVDKWFRFQVAMPKDSVDLCSRLREHDLIKNSNNPSRIRSLFGAFAANSASLHRPDGKGYATIADAIIQYDKINAAISAGLFSQSLLRHAKFTPQLQSMMKFQIERIKENQLSPRLYEIVSKSL